MILPVNSDQSKANQPQSQRPRGLILHEPVPPYLPKAATKIRSVMTRKDKGHYFDINEVDGQLCELSITHDGEFAQAVAMVPVMDERPWNFSSQVWRPAYNPQHLAEQTAPTSSAEASTTAPSNEVTSAVSQDNSDCASEIETLQPILNAKQATPEERKRQLHELRGVSKTEK